MTREDNEIGNQKFIEDASCPQHFKITEVRERGELRVQVLPKFSRVTLDQAKQKTAKMTLQLLKFRELYKGMVMLFLYILEKELLQRLSFKAICRKKIMSSLIFP